MDHTPPRGTIVMSTNEAANADGTSRDVYGQIHPVETPELIAQKRQEFEAELDKIPSAAKVHVAQAQELCPELLTDDFKLMFLRCEVFNAGLAAQRYCQYWTRRVDIFGPDRAFLPLTLGAGGALQDGDTHAALGLGVMTLLPEARDGRGRAVVYFDPSRLDKSKYSKPEVLVRAYWYVFHAALDLRVEAQRHGVVMIGDPGRAKFNQFDRAVAKAFIGSIRGALPVRLSCMHIVRPPAFFSVIYPLVKVFLSDLMRKRMRFHLGPDEKVVQEFETKYGLSKEMLPTAIGGTLRVNHDEWVESRIALGL